MLPTFVGIGAMKSATTTLHGLLDQHPDIATAAQKEVRFFSHDENWRRGVEWYEQQFINCEGHRAVGEISPAYAFHPVFPDAAARMAEVLPNVRLVYIVRDPIERIRSQYVHDTRAGRVLHDPIDVAVRNESRYLDCSRYATQLRRYLEHYEADQLLVVTTEGLRADPGATLERVFRHLGVDPGFRPAIADLRLNAATEVDRRTKSGLRRIRRLPLVTATVRHLPSSVRDRVARVTSDARDGTDEVLSAETRQWLASRLAPEVAALRPHLPDDFDGWGLA